MDNSVFIEHSVHEVQFHLVFGGALAIIVVFFFLRNIRGSIIMGVSIPVSVIATFAVMYAANVTLNIISIFLSNMAYSSL